MANRIVAPAEGHERAQFIEMLKAIRCEGVPKVVEMMRLLETEARDAKRDTARVAAQRAHLRNTFEASQLLYEMEAGTEGDRRSGGGPSVQVLVAMPGGDSRQPTGEELKSILADISDSVRAEVASSDEG